MLQVTGIGARRARAARVAVALVLLLLPLAACEADGSADEAITFWAVNMGPTLEENTEVLDEELARFTEQTGIAVRLEVVSWQDLYQRLMTAVASGSGPDVVNTGNTWSATLQETGAFLPFGQDELAAIGGREKFIPSTLTATGTPGEPPATIPYLGQAYGLYYNTALFEEAGIAGPPATWEELVADAVALSEPDGKWGFSMSAGSATGNVHLAFVLGRQRGVELFDEAGKAQFDSPAMRSVVRTIVGLMDTSGVVNPSDAEQTGITDSLDSLAHGRAAMVPYQSSGRGYLASVGFDGYAVAPLPSPATMPPGGAPVQGFVGGTNLAVFADSPATEDALELVRFLTSPEEQVVLNKTFRTLPVVDKAYDDPAFADPATQTFREILHRSESLPMVPGEAQMEQVLGAAIAGLWGQAATGDAVTDEDIGAALRGAEQQMSD